MCDDDVLCCLLCVDPPLGGVNVLLGVFVTWSPPVTPFPSPPPTQPPTTRKHPLPPTGALWSQEHAVLCI